MTQRAPPRLRVERLVIFESRSPVTVTRDIRLHAGLNIVWAEDAVASESTTDVERAGHGVGKTTFSLMLRAVLGDDGAAVKTMRAHLAEYYDSGGIAAEIVVDGERFAVFRAYSAPSFARRNGTIESLFEEEGNADALDFSTYVTVVGEAACLRHMPTRALPVTGQVIEWSHVLCWIARDQALGLRQYFEWRNDDGTGLRRRAADPPNLVRLALRLLSTAEAEVDAKIAGINRDLPKARETLRVEEQRGTNTRRIVETQLRTWAGVSNTLQMVTDDLFADSVEKELQRKTQQLETKNDRDRVAVAALDLELADVAADIKSQDRIAQLAKARWDETVALRQKDDKSLKEIRERRDKLLTLSGTCQYGAVSYEDCSYVQAQRDTAQLAATRDIKVLTSQIDKEGEREDNAKTLYEREAGALSELTTAREERIKTRKEFNFAIEKRLRQLGEGDSVRRTLTQWQESYETLETAKLRTARSAVVKLERDLAAAEGIKLSAQRQVSERAQQISARVSKLIKVFGVSGRYEPFDEKRPFHMLGADGDAYTVLEILLGDLACAEEGFSDGGGAHPGLLIFDCPREREMSPHLYDRFLRLVDDECRAMPELQIIITTTTPPPEPLRSEPTRILRLSHASNDDLLLKRCIENLLTRATPVMRETEEP
jgi:hypothetical protein